MILTTVCARPHVAAFLQRHFLRNDVVKIPKDCRELFNAIGHYSTTNFQERLIAIPDKLVSFKIALPHPYENHFITQEGAMDLARSMEDFFWDEFKLFILWSLLDDVYKDHAIKQFMEEYGITESMYPIGHFRRQLHRWKLKGLKQPEKELREKLHPRISNQQCMQMWRISKRRISIRTIARSYGIPKSNLHRILQKINLQQAS